MNLAPLIYALGWSLLHSLWQGALLAGMAYVLVSVFYLSSKEKVNLLFSFLGLLLIAFIGTFISYLPDTPIIDAAEHTTPIAITGITPMGKNSNTILMLEHYFPHLAVFYLLGLCFQIAVLVGGYVGIARLRKSNKVEVPKPWLIVYNSLIKRMAIRKKIGFYLSEKVDVPTVIGYFKPIILFPVAALSALDLKQVETILIHELSHIRRNDYVLNLLKCMVEAILFFNPFVRVLSSMLEKEREYTCDDEVLNYGGDAMVYAYALLSLESIRTKKLSTLALGAFDDKEHLLQRIKRITLMKTTTLNVRHKLSALALLIAGVFGLAWINPSNDSIPNPPKAPAPAEVKPSAPALPVPPASPSAEILAPLAPLPPLAAPLNKQDTLKQHDTPKDNAVDSSVDYQHDLDAFFSSKEWQDYQKELQLNANEIGKQAQELNKHFDSPEWKQCQEELTKNSAEIAQHNKAITSFFESPEWKASMKNVQEKAAQLGRLAMKGDSTYFESPEWKAKERELAESSKKMEALSKQMQLKMHSSEMQAKEKALEARASALSQQMVALSTKIETPEFKAKQEALRKKAEELTKRGARFDTIIKQLDRLSIPRFE
ncbi:M56 family metallopeptidase [Olivibacter sp. CPCC 100613]|uniref:M56 family metallopeptidase n=1 Tax=Olivibacter sp. CPCC 100613 TaxID=3079931 RepID=UPI002FF60A24